MSSKKTRKTKKDECCIHEDVMEQIHKDNIKMRPKVYFIFGSALLGIGFAGTAMVSIFFSNVMFYKLRFGAAFGYLGFGALGFRPFIQMFPWIPLAVAIGGIVGGSYFLKKYEIAQKHRFVRLVIAFVALCLTLGFMLDKAGTNKHIEKYDPLRRLYNHENHQPFLHGQITKVHDKQFIVTTPRMQEIPVFVEELHYPTITPGASIRAIGEWRNDKFYVKRIIVK